MKFGKLEIELKNKILSKRMKKNGVLEEMKEFHFYTDRIMTKRLNKIMMST